VEREEHRLVVTAVGPDRSALTVLQEPVLPVPLTSREWDVMRCVAEGMTNVEIAAFLTVTQGTVKKHLEHIYAKLGVRSRTTALACLRHALQSLTCWSGTLAAVQIV
jgi:DNA-binding NarL/FixJ family response regulator